MIGLPRRARGVLCAAVVFAKTLRQCQTTYRRRDGARKVMRRARVWSKSAAACVSALLVSACAGMPRDASLPVSDPHEEANRQVMATNQKVLGPLSEAVNAAVPGPVHDRLHDLNSNLKEPRILLNNVLQWRLDAAARTATRFF